MNGSSFRFRREGLVRPFTVKAQLVHVAVFTLVKVVARAGVGVGDVPGDRDRALEHPQGARPDRGGLVVGAGDARRLGVADLGQERQVAVVAELPLVVLAVGAGAALAAAVARVDRQQPRLLAEVGLQAVLRARATLGENENPCSAVG